MKTSAAASFLLFLSVANGAFGYSPYLKSLKNDSYRLKKNDSYLKNLKSAHPTETPSARYRASKTTTKSSTPPPPPPTKFRKGNSKKDTKEANAPNSWGWGDASSRIVMKRIESPEASWEGVDPATAHYARAPVNMGSVNMGSAKMDYNIYEDDRYNRPLYPSPWSKDNYSRGRDGSFRYNGYSDYTLNRDDRAWQGDIRHDPRGANHDPNSAYANTNSAEEEVMVRYQLSRPRRRRRAPARREPEEAYGRPFPRPPPEFFARPPQDNFARPPPGNFGRPPPDRFERPPRGNIGRPPQDYFEPPRRYTW